MKIAFYANHHYWGGLSPNGGSRTILLSCEALRKLGHAANVVTFSDKFKWFKHPKPDKKVPKDADAVVAVSISEVSKVMGFKDKIRAVWLRPMEVWQKSEKECLSLLRKFHLSGGKVMVNSKWQHSFFQRHCIEANMVYAGMDFDKWENRNIRTGKPEVLAQYSKNPLKGYKYFKQMNKIAPDFVYRIFGKSKKITWPELVDVYNRADYFFVGGKQEGWNNCAAEAALCGCTLVVRNRPRNGCFDFVTPENSLVFDKVEDAVRRIRQGDGGDVRDVVGRLRRIGSREVNMEYMVKVLCES